MLGQLAIITVNWYFLYCDHMLPYVLIGFVCGSNEHSNGGLCMHTCARISQMEVRLVILCYDSLLCKLAKF